MAEAKAALAPVLQGVELTEEALKAPPFALLHELVCGVVKHGFGGGLYPPAELDAAALADDDAKAAFLRRAILCTHYALGEEPCPALHVDPLAAAKGSDPEKASAWLAKLGAAAAAPAAAEAPPAGPRLREVAAGQLAGALSLLQQWGFAAVDSAEALSAAAAARAAQQDDAVSPPADGGTGVQPRVRRLPREVAGRVAEALSQLAAAGFPQVPDVAALAAACLQLPAAPARTTAVVRALVACRPAPTSPPTQLSELGGLPAPPPAATAAAPAAAQAAAPAAAPAGGKRASKAAADMDPARRNQISRKWEAYCEAAWDNDVETLTDMIDGPFAMPLEPIAPDTDGPLSEAACGGAADVVSTLLARGADPDHRGEKRKTALMRAVTAEQEATAKLLLDAGADPRLLLVGAEQWHDPEAQPDGSPPPRTTTALEAEMTAGGLPALAEALGIVSWQGAASGPPSVGAVADGAAKSAGIAAAWELCKVGDKDVGSTKDARTAVEALLAGVPKEGKPKPVRVPLLFQSPPEPDWGPRHPRWERRVMVLKEWDPKELLSDVPKDMRKLLEGWDIKQTIAAQQRRAGADAAAADDDGPVTLEAAEAALADLERKLAAAAAAEQADLKAKRDAAKRRCRELRSDARAREISDAGGVQVHAACGALDAAEYVSGPKAEAAAAAGKCCLILGGADVVRALKVSAVVVELIGSQPQAVRRVVAESVLNGRSLVADMGGAETLADLTGPLDAAMPGLSALLLNRVLTSGSIHQQLPPADLEVAADAWKADQVSKFRFSVVTTSKRPQQALLDACYVVGVEGSGGGGGPQNLGGIYRGLRDGEDVYGDGECMQERMEKWVKMEPIIAQINAAGIAYTKVGEMLEMKGTKSQYARAGL
eukprot:TRINITY_DN4723_c0_g3_i1.p1 TRINITY_DN4723_c0_g3~~TRINITY_DN4723_c0_g3_i1.p1  ORF type:complete len:904 (+),score=348.47 TRINITY_DN4723_c0_g3_i1:63-2714(+)